MKVDQLLALREAVIEAGFGVLPLGVPELIEAVAPLPPDVVTVTVRKEGERMSDEAFRAERQRIFEERRAVTNLDGGYGAANSGRPENGTSTGMAAGPLNIEGRTSVAPVDEQSRQSPSDSGPLTPDRASDAPDVQALIAAKQYGKQPVPSGLQVADKFAASVEVPGDVRELANECGLVIVPSHRGIEARRADVLEFCTAGVDAMRNVLLGLRARELQRMLG